jgi:hypothetical protein
LSPSLMVFKVILGGMNEKAIKDHIIQLLEQKSDIQK